MKKIPSLGELNGSSRASRGSRRSADGTPLRMGTPLRIRLEWSDEQWLMAEAERHDVAVVEVVRWAVRAYRNHPSIGMREWEV